jgi:cellulose synthase operon protein YhjQ
MTCITFVSPLGGTGQTTVLANLASLWSAGATPCLAVDLCAQSSLGRHLGQTQAAQDGWAPRAVAGQWWAEAALENSAGVRWLPFGNAAAEASQLSTLHTLLAAQPQWLATQLQSIALDPQSLVLLDAPQWPQPLASQALACADLVVVCLDASPRAALLQPQVQALLSQAPSNAQCALLATRFSPRRASQSAALQTLQQQWQEQLSPYVLHEDEHVSAALAAAHCVCAFAPQAQSAHDLHGIANWLLARCPQDQDQAQAL